MAAIVTFSVVTLFASFVYLLGFFGIGFFQSLVISRAAHEDVTDDKDEINNYGRLMVKEDSGKIPCAASPESDDLKSAPTKFMEVTSEEDEEVVRAAVEGKIPSYALESKLGDCRRHPPRSLLQRTTGKSLKGLPLEGFDYMSILGQCCEMPVGYVQIPVGIAGTLFLDGNEFSVPMATMESCLVASTNRGCKPIYASGGGTSSIFGDPMTRAPVVRFGPAKRVVELKMFFENPLNFNSSSRFARLQSIKCAIKSRFFYIIF